MENFQGEWIHVHIYGSFDILEEIYSWYTFNIVLKWIFNALDLYQKFTNLAWNFK